jgi:hypothetical protein
MSRRTNLLSGLQEMGEGEDELNPLRKREMCCRLSSSNSLNVLLPQIRHIFSSRERDALAEMEFVTAGLCSFASNFQSSV